MNKKREAASIVFRQPDPRFGVVYARLPIGRATFVFAAMGEQSAPHRAAWRYLPGTQIVLVGDVDEALAGFIGNYSSNELHEMLSISYEMLTALRRHLGIGIDSPGRGGARPNSGPKKKSTPVGGGGPEVE